MANDITPIVGQIPVTQLGRDDIQILVTVMGTRAPKRTSTRGGTTLSKKTIWNELAPLSNALDCAVTEGLIASNPCNDITFTPPPALVNPDDYDDGDEMNILEIDEFDSVYAAIDPYYRPLIRFLVHSGCRWAEATALRPSDANRRTNTVRIARAWKGANSTNATLGQPKFGSKRTIQVPADVLADLDYSGKWLFTKHTAPGVEPVKNYTFSPDYWHPALVKAKLGKPVRIHDLRHTCASWLIAAGWPPPDVMEHMGHRSVTTTMIYTHTVKSTAADLAAKAAAFITAQRGATVIDFPPLAVARS